METELDPQVVNLTKAIRQTESGGNFQAKGKSGEYGAYQFTQPTWDTYSKKHGVNVSLEQATPEQQNEVAYKQIKEWKDKGHNVGEIASMWNAGESNSNAYKENNVGTNKYGVHYDTPAYAKSVATAYQTLKNGGKVEVDPNNPSSTVSQDTPTSQTFEDYIKNQKQIDPNASPIEQHGTGLGGVGGSLVAGLLKPFAKVGTSLVNTAQDIAGKPETQPFSGKFLGDVRKVGEGIDVGGNPLSEKNKKAIGDSLKTGAEIGTDIATGEGAVKGIAGLLGKSKNILENPEIIKIMKQGVQSRQGAIDRLGVVLKNMPVSEVGGKKEKLILQAIQKLNPSLVEKQSLLKTLIKAGFNTAKNIALTKLLGDTVGGFIHKSTQ